MSRRPSRRLRLESLESRQMMAYDIDFSGGVFDVEGGSGNDQISIFYNLNTAQSKVVVEVRDLETDTIMAREERPIGEVTRVDVRAFAGRDSIYNTTGVPMRAYGGSDYDYILGGSASDELNGEAGDDTLNGGKGGSDILRGGTGADTYSLSAEAAGADVVEDNGTTEANFLSFGNGSFLQGVTIDLGSTAVQPIGGGASFRLSNPLAIEGVAGTNLDDVIIGNSRDNRIYGNPGNDQLFGRGGNDLLLGSFGNDVLSGEAGNDALKGEVGDDRYVFGPGPQGSDTLRDIHLSINTGIDTLDFSSFGQAVAINLNNPVAVQNSQLTLTLEDGANIENVIGSAFGDTIIGNAKDNVLFGRGGNDYFRGGAGNDTINGEAGADIVYGDEGNDKITSDAADIIFGGLGTDTFDGVSESLSFIIKNPRPTRYRDWGTK